MDFNLDMPKGFKRTALFVMGINAAIFVAAVVVIAAAVKWVIS